MIDLTTLTKPCHHCSRRREQYLQAARNLRDEYGRETDDSAYFERCARHLPCVVCEGSNLVLSDDGQALVDWLMTWLPREQRARGADE